MQLASALSDNARLATQVAELQAQLYQLNKAHEGGNDDRSDGWSLLFFFFVGFLSLWP